MKKMVNLFVCLCLFLSLGTGNLTSIKAQENLEVPEGTYQLDTTFPISLEDDQFDDSFVPNQVSRFMGYEGQGYLWLKSDKISDFKIYINSLPVKTVSGDLSEWHQFDISDLTVNGLNTLQVNRIDSGDALLEIKIPYPTLVDKTDEWQDNDNFKFIDEIINSEIENGFTSAQIVVTYNGQIIKQDAYGIVNSYTPDGEQLSEGETVNNETLYDLSDNTKVFATNFALQKLVSDGELNIDHKVSEIIPDFQDNPYHAIRGKKDLTVRHLLEHQSGFPENPHYYNNNYDANASNGIGENSNHLFTQNRDEILQKIIDTPLTNYPGVETKASAVDYLLLGLVVETLTGEQLDDYVQGHFYEPLELSHTTFNPLDADFTKEEIAASELNGNSRNGLIDFENIRTDTIQGETHDETAFYSMDGVSGHAGLFSNATELSLLTQVMLNRGGYGEHKFFSSDVVDQFMAPTRYDATQALGWKRNGSNGNAWAFSPLVSNSTIGMTGSAGTLSVIDLENNFSLVLLTNANNTPLVDGDFVGDDFLTGNYGLIATLAADAIRSNGSEANDAKLVDMFIRNYETLTAVDTPTGSNQAAFDALHEVLHERKDGSTLITNFIEPNIYQQIETYMQDIADE